MPVLAGRLLVIYSLSMTNIPLLGGKKFSKSESRNDSEFARIVQLESKRKKRM